MAICPNCGETAGPGRSSCPSCGTELPDEGDEPAERQHRDSKPGRESHNRTGGSEPAPSRTGAPGTDSSRPPNRDHEHSNTPEPRQPRQSQQSGRQSRAGGHRGDAGSGRSLFGTSGKVPTEPDVNDILWTIGWSPVKTILGFGLLFLVLAVGMEMDGNGIGSMTFVGLVIGSVVWYLGVKEVNEHYAAFRDAFFARSANRAESRLGIDRSEVIDAFNFRSHRGGSPFLVEPSNYYLADHMVLSDVSVSVDQNSQYDMENRGADSDGTTKNIYYDNIESITTNDEGALTNLRIVTSRGENLAVNTVDQRVAEEAQGRLRSKMRDVRRARR